MSDFEHKRFGWPEWAIMAFMVVLLAASGCGKASAQSLRTDSLNLFSGAVSSSTSNTGLVLVAKGCPADRPNKRSVVGGTLTCTLLACVKLICEPGQDADCRYLHTSDCNTCTQLKQMVCLSNDELQRAEASGK